MPFNTAAIPPLSIATDITTLLGPLAALAAAAILIALAVVGGGMVVEALDARARTRLRAHARPAAPDLVQTVRRPRAA